jgi:hypothetical protein
MTKVWGPMGWMTLHSISVAYPDNPSEADKTILNSFMDSFGATITCINCRQHFATMFTGYKNSVPTWANSKQDLFFAICRLHNTVNKRLDKPIPKTVAECIAFLKTATTYTGQTEFRNKYIEYLQRDWTRFGRGTTYQLVAFNAIKNMQKINETYWNPREISYSNVNISESDILTYPNQPVKQKIIFSKPILRNVTFPIQPKPIPQKTVFSKPTVRNVTWPPR